MSRIVRVIHALFGLFEFFLFLRFVMKLLGANTVNFIVYLFYQVSWFAVAPFQAIFPDWIFSFGQSFEMSTICAMVGYWVVWYALGKIAKALTKPQPAEKRQAENKSPTKKGKK